MKAARNLGKEVGTRQACEALGVSHATFYRWLEPQTTVKARPTPPLALSEQERHDVNQLLHCERFQDDAPRQIYAALLDEGQYHCSVRTMYRILKSVHGDVKERRKQVQRPVYEKPELLATTPNEVWSWDITKLKGPVTWTYFYLYVIMDIFSRYVVGWMVAHRESATLAKRLIEQTAPNRGSPPASSRYTRTGVLP